MLTDEVNITISAGKGGDGAVAFDKNKMSLGPTGGRGGDGGNVYFQGVSDLTALNKYKRKRDYYAEDGANGKSDRSTGHAGKDLILTVPIGSVLRNMEAGNNFDITEVGQTVLVAKGGLGGRGNFYFRSPSNTSPKECEKGKSGQEYSLFIELHLIADIGLIGLPNAGKSSLLNELTRAQSKVASYPFTTLEPNLGVLGKVIIADIPGLIEGASMGKGLGVKFLKHVERTGILFHCISLQSDDLLKDYYTVRRELEKHSNDLAQKDEIILLTKHDLAEKNKIQDKLIELQKVNPQIFVISIHDWKSLVELKDKIFIFFPNKREGGGLNFFSSIVR